MGTVKVMVNGLPGNMAEVVARQVLADHRYELIPHSLTGPEISDFEYHLEGRNRTRFNSGSGPGAVR